MCVLDKINRDGSQAQDADISTAFWWVVVIQNKVRFDLTKMFWKLCFDGDTLFLASAGY